MPAFTVRDFISIPRVSSVEAAPDGMWLAVEVQRLDAGAPNYLSEIWRVPRHGAPEPLLHGASSYRQPYFRADGALGFLTNLEPGADPAAPPSPGARSQVWILPPGAERPTELTQEPLGVSAFRFAQGADCMVVIAPVLLGVPHDEQRATAEHLAKRDPSPLHYTKGPVHLGERGLQPSPHYIVYDGSGAGRRDVTPTADREHREAMWDLSRDGRLLVVVSERIGSLRTKELILLAIDTDTGARRVLFDEPDEQAGVPKISPDGSAVAFTHLRWSKTTPFRERLYTLGVDGRGLHGVAHSWDRWARPVGWSADGTGLWVTADDHARNRLFHVDLATDSVTAITEEQSVQSVGLSATGPIGIRHGLRLLPEVFEVGPDRKVRPIPVFTGNEALSDLGTIEEMTVTGADGVLVHSWLLLPHGEGPFPAVIWIHGGPFSAWRDEWRWQWNPQLLVAAGFAVVMPNPRGSTGFGQTFIDRVWHNRYGAESYQDVLAVADAAAADPRVDPSRMAAMGWSFGGTLTNWIGGNTDRFRCLVTQAGIFDFGRFSIETDDAGGWLHIMGVDQWADPIEFNQYSPHTRVARWKTPALIIHGERDTNVPIGQSLALFTALQSRGVESELLVFPDERHAIVRPQNLVVFYEQILTFLRRHLMTDSDVR